MANYYTNRIMAIKDIDGMLHDDIKKEIIVYKITMKYGFGKKIVEERIKQIEEMQSSNRDENY